MKSDRMLFAGLLGLLLATFTIEAATLPLVNHADQWRYRKGTNAPQANWQAIEEASLDGTWLTGPGGFGYGDSDDATVLADMLGLYRTIFIRKSFEITVPADPAQHLYLTMDWDDGFVAYLDGVEIARALAPGSPGTEPVYNANATATHEASGGGTGATQPTTYNLGAVGARLATGLHVLAIHGLNESINSSDFSLIADLAIGDPPPPSNTSFLVSHTNTWHYRKGTNAPQTQWASLANAALDDSWLTGPGGFGYADGDDRTTLADMRNGYSTVYIRQTFELTPAMSTNGNLGLVVDYDDGFVAYLDGVEVARGNAPGSAGTEPAFNSLATANHEASGGGGSAPTTYDLGPVASRLAPGTHVLALIGLNDSLDSSDVSLIADLVVGPAATNQPGVIASDTTWTLANSPYVITQDLTVTGSATLTIEPGVTIRVNNGVGITINGRLIAEGTAEQPILFTRNTGATSWDGLSFANNSQESRLVYVDMAYANSAGHAIHTQNSIIFLDHCTWTNLTVQVLDFNSTSLILRRSVIPSVQGVELVHFAGSVPGYAIMESNIFGSTLSGYADVIDFTGGNRPGPILQFLYNTMIGTSDDMLDLDSTDAHIEGNIFMNGHKNNSSDSLSFCVTSGKDNNNTSELTIVRNIFYNVDHAILVKGEGFSTIINNTFVGATAAFISFNEPGRGQPDGKGAYLDGNVFWNPAGFNGSNFANIPTNLNFQLTVNRSVLPGASVYPGLGNLNADPRLANLTNITDLRADFQLLPDSPARGAGPNGLDMGAFVPSGASFSGVPGSPTAQTTADVVINGPGLVAFRYKLNDGPYSPEIPITNIVTGQSLQLSNLVDGTYTLSVMGKNSAGVYTNTPINFRTWTVTTLTDTDGDGLPDEWETAHGLNPNHAADGAEDPDQDGLTNAEEYRAGTLPRDAASTVRLDGLERDGAGVHLRFTSVAGKRYRLERTEALLGSPWLTVVDQVPGTGAIVEVTDAGAGSESVRFYRLRLVP